MLHALRYELLPGVDSSCQAGNLDRACFMACTKSEASVCATAENSHVLGRREPFKSTADPHFVAVWDWNCEDQLQVSDAE